MIFFGISLINIDNKETYINFKYEIPILNINNDFSVIIPNNINKDNNFADFIYDILVNNISVDILNYFRYEKRSN